MINTLAASLTVRAIGWALLQSLWQDVLVGAVTALALTALYRSTANRRYVVACLGLVAIVAVPVVTAALRASDMRSSSIARDVPVRQAFLSSEVPGRPAVSEPASGHNTSPSAATASSERRPSSERLQAWSVIAVPVWLLGVVALSSRLVVSWFLVERIRRAAARPVPQEWLSRVTVMADRLRVTRPVRIIESAVVNVPMVIGWLRPAILLPASALTGLSTSQLEAVIAHELAHVRRHDYLVNMLQTAIETLVFYHPATWWISQRIRVEREDCCDDVAVDVCGDRLTYARALADLEQLRSTDLPLALAATGGPLVRRIRRLLGLSSTDGDHSPTWIVVGLVLTALSFAALGESLKGASSPRPALAQTASTDTGVIRGRVVDDRSGRPLANASVELSGGGQATTASTDADGRYEMRGVPEGEWHVLVQASGYVPARYGQRNSGEVGTSVNVRAGQLTSRIDVALQAAAVMSGRIFSDSGEGLSGVEVELLAERYLPGGAAPVPVAFGQTEAFGMFRMGDLQPGTYYVRAYVPSTVRPSRAAATEVYAPTYFPQTTRLHEAQPVLVGAGEERLDVDFGLATVATYVVTGMLVDPTATSLDQARIALMSGEGGSSAFNQTIPVSANGSFEFRNVVPGSYVLSVLDRAKTVRWMGVARPIIVDSDVSGIEIVARAGARLEGRVVRDGGDPLPFDPSSIRLEILQRMQNGPIVRAEAGSGVWTSGWGGNVQRDGGFSVESPAGVTSLLVSGLPPNWMVKAIRLEGSDITDQAIDLGDGIHRQVQIVLTDRIANIVGTVNDRNGRVSNYIVVVFPEDRDRWTPPSRLVRGVRPLQDGSFRIEALPAADYLAIAVESLPQGAWADPNVLERLYPLATRFRLGDGEQRTVPLKLSPTPDGLLAQRELRNVSQSLSARRHEHE